MERTVERPVPIGGRREFHEQVLVTGALPMSVLEKKIDVWIAGGGQ